MSYVVVRGGGLPDCFLALLKDLKDKVDVGAAHLLEAGCFGDGVKVSEDKVESLLTQRLGVVLVRSVEDLCGIVNTDASQHL